jgi:hypothetical protein
MISSFFFYCLSKTINIETLSCFKPEIKKAPFPKIHQNKKYKKGAFFLKFIKKQIEKFQKGAFF